MHQHALFVASAFSVSEALQLERMDGRNGGAGGGRGFRGVEARRRARGRHETRQANEDN